MSEVDLLPHERERENALVLLVSLDYFAALGLMLFGYLSDSLTLSADGLRAFLLITIDVFALVVLRRIHRHRFAEYEFGTGKLECLVNLAVGLGMYAAAVWIVISAFNRLEGQAPAAPLSIAMGIAFADANLCLNIYGLYRLYRANRAAPAVIMRAQVRSRLAMTISSSIVFIVVLASVSAPDPTVGNLLDVLGSVFVSVIILSIGTSMMRESLPDLLDKSIAPKDQLLVYRTLAQHFDSYDDIIGMRSRRSGRQALVDIELGFADDATIGDIVRRSHAIAEDLRRFLHDAQVRVLPVVSRWARADAERPRGAVTAMPRPVAAIAVEGMPVRSGSYRYESMGTVG
jgi:cation diffusion facilitator family transporter